jgi:hypothetical protein
MRLFKGFSVAPSHTSRWDMLRKVSAQRHVFLLSIAIVLTVAVWLYWVSSGPMGTLDFSTYYAAARALRIDPHANIYSQAVFDRSGVDGHVSQQPPLPYTVPPLAALVLVPLTVFPFAIAARIWLAINAILWLASALILCTELRTVLPVPRFSGSIPAAALLPVNQSNTQSNTRTRISRIWRGWVEDPAVLPLLVLMVPLCLVWGPAVIALSFGQIDFVVLLALVLALPLLRTHHDRWAGIALGCGAMIKLMPILLLIYLALIGRRRAAGAGLVTLIILALGTAAIVGPQTAWAALPQILQVSVDHASLSQNEALVGPVTYALTAVAPSLAGAIRIVEYLLLAALAVSIGVILWWLTHSSRSSVDRVANTAIFPPYAIALCGIMLVSPLAWEHHYVWVLPSASFVLVVALRSLLETRSPHGFRRAAIQCGAAVGAVMLAGANLPVGWDRTPWLATPHVLGQPVAAWLHELRSIGTLILLVLAVAYWQRNALAVDR